MSINPEPIGPIIKRVMDTITSNTIWSVRCCVFGCPWGDEQPTLKEANVAAYQHRSDSGHNDPVYSWRAKRIPKKDEKRHRHE